MNTMKSVAAGIGNLLIVVGFLMVFLGGLTLFMFVLERYVPLWYHVFTTL